MRKLLLALPPLVGFAALSGPAQAALVARLARPDPLASALATPDAAVETVQYHGYDRRAEWRRREEARRRAEWRRRHGYHH